MHSTISRHPTPPLRMGEVSLEGELQGSFLLKSDKGVFIHTCTYGCVILGLTAGVGNEPPIREQPLHLFKLRYQRVPVVSRQQDTSYGRTSGGLVVSAKVAVRGYLLPRANPLIAQVIKQPTIVYSWYSPLCVRHELLSAAREKIIYGLKESFRLRKETVIQRAEGHNSVHPYCPGRQVCHVQVAQTRRSTKENRVSGRSNHHVNRPEDTNLEKNVVCSWQTILRQKQFSIS